MRSCHGCGRVFNDLREEYEHDCFKPAIRDGDTFRKCPACKTWASLFGTHWCVNRKGNDVDITKKRWDHKLQCWVLTSEPPPAKFWDSKTGTWVEEKDYYGPGSGKTQGQTIEVASCAVPARTLGPGSTGPASSTSYSTGTKYTPTYPWDKVDRKKWPNTWMTLFTLYHLQDWWKGHYISAEDWEARLRGDYRPQKPKTTYSYYGGYDECEG